MNILNGLRKVVVFILVGLSIISCEQTHSQEIDERYISFRPKGVFEFVSIDHVPYNPDGKRTIPTLTGNKEVSFIEGYRLNYHVDGKPFANIKVESTTEDRYMTDSSIVAGHIKLILENTPSADTATLNLMNDRFYGMRKTQYGKTDQIVAFYVLFQAPSTIIYFYFNNSDKYGNATEFTQLRDKFLVGYLNSL